MPGGVSSAPLTIKIMLVVLGIETLVAAGVGVWVAVEAFGEEGMQIVGTLFLAVIALGLAAFLGAAVRGMAAHQPWTRSAAIAWQVLQIGLALGTWYGGQGVVWLAFVLFIPAVVVLLCVFRESVTEWLSRELPEDG